MRVFAAAGVTQLTEILNFDVSLPADLVNAMTPAFDAE